jgi:hypothetical protein
MSTDAPVASSATPDAPLSASDQAVANGDVAGYRAVRAAERAGKPIPTPSADSSSAEPVEQAASTDAQTDTPASETGRPQKNAETRIKELLAKEKAAAARAEAAERRLAELEARPSQPDAKRAEPSPAPVGKIDYPKELASYDDHLAAHPEASYDDYMDARADYRTDQREQLKARATQEETARTQAAETVRQRDARAKQQFDEAVKADPDFWTNVSDEIKALRPTDSLRDPKTGKFTGQVNRGNVLADEILKSDVAPQLMRHFSDHPEEMRRILALPEYDDFKEALVSLKLTLKGSAKPAEPPTPQLTQAPKPPTTVGSRTGVPADAIDAAVAADDVAAFKAAKLRQRAAQHGIAVGR